jgi:hypothetical protein
MQYKTIVLRLLQQRPEIHDRLRKKRRLLQTVNAYATDFKAKHNAWMEVLLSARPESDPSQISSEALELALEDLQDSLRHEFSTDDSEPLSLDEAMA